MRSSNLPLNPLRAKICRISSRSPVGIVSMCLRSPSSFFDLLALTLGSEIVADRHAEAVGQQVRKAEHDHHNLCKSSADRAGHDRERRHAAIHRAKHGVPDIAMPSVRGESSRDGLRQMFGLKVPSARPKLGVVHCWNPE
jgi:hypothetical protein